MKKRLFPIWIAALYLIGAACSSTTSMQVLQPADIVLPDHVKTIVTVDRSKPEKGFGNILEGALSGEEIGQDRAGRQSALEGVTSALTRTPRFNVRQSGMELTGSKGGNSFAAPLPWPEIESICQQYGADAVLTTETFDSDVSVQTSERKETKKDKDGNETVRIVTDARQEIDVKIGWRVYDPKERLLLDEFTTIREARENASGDSEEAARNGLPNQVSIVRDVSYLTGEEYGMRIAPVWVNVQRSFYVTGKGLDKDEMQKAGRLAESNQWDKAAEVWRMLVDQANDPKNAGRAAMNMAVANERAGQLQSALDWAQRAYTDFNHKAARSYIRVIEQRILDQERLRRQLKEVDP